MKVYYGVAANDQLVRVTSSYEKALNTNKVHPNSVIYDVQRKTSKSAISFFKERFGLSVAEGCDI